MKDFLKTHVAPYATMHNLIDFMGALSLFVMLIVALSSLT